MDKEQLRQWRDAAAGKIPCDLLITNAKVLDVFNRKWFESDVAIDNGKVVALGKRKARKVIDAKGKYLTPGLLDAHLHIESTLLTPDSLNDILLPRGITGIVADPHEIANVSGKTGLDYIFDVKDKVTMDIHVQLPSCVPSTPLENAGARLSAADLKPYYGRALGLAEVMDAPAAFGDDDMLNKIYDALSAHAVVDGHGATLDNVGLDVYSTLNIKSDHECTDLQGMVERLRRGMYVHVRLGTVAQNLYQLVDGITEANANRVCFCTDDRHVDDLIQTGGVDLAVREAIRLGVSEETALSCATFSPTRCYNLSEQGAVAPGYYADLVLWDNPIALNAVKVFKRGKLVAENGKVKDETRGFPVPKALTTSVNYAPLKKEDFALRYNGTHQMHVIGVDAGQIVTRHEIIEINGDEFTADAKKDLAKLAVIERHHATGNVSVCAVTGFALQKGAIATTVAHDSHNIIVIGMNDDDMLLAVTHLKELGGGYTVVADGKVLADVQLEVCGLLTARDTKALLADLKKIHTVAESIMNKKDFNPFQMLSFISLPVIPFLKLTDKGLVDVMKFTFILPVE